MKSNGLLGNIFEAIQIALAPLGYSVTDHADGTASIEKDTDINASWKLSANGDKISLRWSGYGDHRDLPKKVAAELGKAVKAVRGY